MQVSFFLRIFDHVKGVLLENFVQAQPKFFVGISKTRLHLLPVPVHVILWRKKTLLFNPSLKNKFKQAPFCCHTVPWSGYKSCHLYSRHPAPDGATENPRHPRGKHLQFGNRSRRPLGRWRRWGLALNGIYNHLLFHCQGQEMGCSPLNSVS